MLKRLLAFAGLALLLAAGLWFSQWGEDASHVSGLIEADEIRVGSRVGGRVARVLVEEGQTVRKGDVLVELEPYDLLAKRTEAQKLFDARRAEYDRLKAGFRDEEIAQAKAVRDQLAARLEKLKEGPRKQEIAAAAAQVRLAESEQELAQVNYQRAKTLGLAGTRAELDRAESELKVARERVQVRRAELDVLKEGTRSEDIAAAQAQLEEAHQAWLLRREGYRAEEKAQAQAAMEAAQAALQTIERQIEELTIKAPIDAVVEAVDLQPGDLVGANAPVLSLMDISHLWVRAYVPEDQLGVQVGQRVQVSVDSYPGDRFTGHISFIARQAEFTPSNVQTPEERSKQVFRIKVALDEGLDRLRPGMAADVWLGPPGESP
jgi:multidrug resistance efflux pump